MMASLNLHKTAELLKLPPGYTLRVRPSNHLGVYKPDGTPLRTPSGLPVTTAASPSDWRSRKNETSRIRRAIEGGR